MKIIVEPAFETPLVSLAVANRAGTIMDPLGAEGAVCQMAELSLRGAGDLDREAMDERIDGLGAFMGFALRRDYLSLRAGCLHRHLDELVDLIGMVLQQPQMREEEREKLGRETLNELDELRDDDASLAQRYFSKYCHPGLVYGRTAIGTEASLATLKLDQLQGLRKQLFTRDQLVLGIAGAISEEEAQAIAGAIETEEGEPCRPPSLEAPPAPTGRRLILVDKPERQQCQVAIGHIAPAYGTEDHDRLRVAETAFGGMFTSRMMQEIRVKHGWSYGAHCSMHRARGQHTLLMSMAPAADVCAPAVGKILEMFGALRDEGLTQDEFDFTRSYLAGSAAFTRATANQRLARKIQEEIYELPAGFGDGFPERLEGFARSEINDAVGRCLKPEALCVVVVCTASEVRDELEALGFDSVEVVDYRSY